MRSKLDDRAGLIKEAIRRIRIEVPDSEPFLDSVERMLESELNKAPLSLSKLIKLGRRRALDRVSAQARKAAASLPI